MRKIKSTISLILAFLFVSTSMFAAEKSLTGKEFKALRKANKKLVVVDARKASDYAKMHIMKSVSIPYAELNNDGPVAGMLKEPAALAAYFAKKGISNDSKIVIYDDGSSKYNSRVYWALKYAGATDVQLLHKDMNQWKMARIPLTKTATPIKKGSFTVKVDHSISAEMKAVQTASKNASAIIIDVRDAVEYDGSFESSEGHIPSAINIPYKEVLKANGSFKSKVALEQLAAKYNLSADKEIMVYCVTSVRAGVVYFALKNILGYSNVKTFDGAYNEWSADSNNTISK
jgi:thiosulfate/3-mercaptopyruvate sulfurtransferase